MDILRRFNFADFRTGANLNLDLPEDEMIRGIFDKGFFVKIGNALHKGLQFVSDNPQLKDKIVHYAPALARKLVSLVPGVSALADPVEKALKMELEAILKSQAQQKYQ